MFLVRKYLLTVFFMNCSINVLQFLRKIVAALRLMLSRLGCGLYSEKNTMILYQLYNNNNNNNTG
jgi:hypothetical protein